MRAPHSIKKVSIRVLLTSLSMVTLSFVSKKKISVSPTQELLEIDCPPLKPCHNLHQEVQLPTLRTWVCSIMILLEAVLHMNAADIEPPFGNRADTV